MAEAEKVHKVKIQVKMQLLHSSQEILGLHTYLQIYQNRHSKTDR